MSISLLALLCAGASACVGATEGEEYDEQTGQAESELSYVAEIVGARAVFDSHGERMLVTDTRSDGHSAVSEIRRWNHFCWASGGYGTSQQCNYDLPEGQLIEFRACVADRGNPFLSCSPWVTANTAD
ncbi:uncharacterized protein SOCE26_075760 [Sorangium cellulosum]|uniref:Secreted protein n=1 Tax=Sorangium cellulosum TaxID=56 RepID=A0A2L0F3J1_SORCE|nr:uncharacterized protein SOCE26_075760 [Sorangium cellulosum]